MEPELQLSKILPPLCKSKRSRSLPLRYSTLVDQRCPHSKRGQCWWGSFCRKQQGRKKFVPSARCLAEEPAIVELARTNPAARVILPLLTSTPDPKDVPKVLTEWIKANRWKSPPPG